MNVYYCEKLPSGTSQHQLAYLLLEHLIRTEYPGLSGPFHYAKRTGGKPWLPEHPWLEFNVTHCSLCVAAACAGQPVGVDAERRFSWRSSLARHICHPAELEFLNRLDGRGIKGEVLEGSGLERKSLGSGAFGWKDLNKKELGEEERERKVPEAWLQRIWSRKESYLKCTGMGLRKDLRQILTLSREELEPAFEGDGTIIRKHNLWGAGEEMGAPQWRRIEPEPGAFFWIQEIQTPEYTMAVCMKNREPAKWRKWKPEELLP